MTHRLVVFNSLVSLKTLMPQRIWSTVHDLVESMRILLCVKDEAHQDQLEHGAATANDLACGAGPSKVFRSKSYIGS